MKEYILYPICKLLDIFVGGNSLPVLMYHSVSDHNSRLAVRPESFEKQVKFLHDKGYKTIQPLDILKTKNFKKKILITFDDGFKDSYINALPVLKKYGFTATVFISTDYIGKKSIYCTREGDRGLDMLNEKEILALEQAGWIIGNHFASHRDLDKLSTEKIDEEAINSIDRLEGIIQNKATARIFSYPHSRVSAKVIDLIAQKSIMAFGGRNVFYTPGDNHNIPRVEVAGYHWPLNKFRMLTSKTYLGFKKVINK